MKKAFLLMLVTVCILCFVSIKAFFVGAKSSDSTENSERIFKIRICKVIEHEAINSVVDGIIDYLKKLSSTQVQSSKDMREKGRKYDISVETCQGNMALASQIIAKFAASKPDVVVTVGTVPSQAAYKFAQSGQIKVVFSSVTNPKDLATTNISNCNITGVSNFVPLEPQIDLFKKIQPNLRKLGILYNTGEANSASIVEALKPICRAAGLELIEQGISRISELIQSAERLAKKVDAIFISNDNMALSGISSVVSLCRKAGIPVYVSDTDQVIKGCLAALGPNQYEIGVQTGEMVRRICDGEDINEIAVEYPKKSELYLNLKRDASGAVCINITDEIRSEATKIFE